jgi:hypothetical protein
MRWIDAHGTPFQLDGGSNDSAEAKKEQAADAAATELMLQGCAI